ETLKNGLSAHEIPKPSDPPPSKHCLFSALHLNKTRFTQQHFAATAAMQPAPPVACSQARSESYRQVRGAAPQFKRFSRRLQGADGRRREPEARLALSANRQSLFSTSPL